MSTVEDDVDRLLAEKQITDDNDVLKPAVKRRWKKHLIVFGAFLVTFTFFMIIFFPVFDRRAFASATTYGLVADQTTSTYEYDAQEGFYCDAIKLSSDGEYSYYAIVSTGDSGTENDGYIRTIKVNETTGVITASLIDSLEYDTSEGYGPSICKVGDEMYVICYCDTTGARQTLVTVSISDVGSIPAAVTETFTFALDGIDASSRAHVINVYSNTYAVAYTDVDGDGQLATINITSAGDISAATTDTQEFDAANGYFPRMALVDNDTIVIFYETTDSAADGRDGKLVTYNITYGVITDVAADSYSPAIGIMTWPDIMKVSGNIYLLAHEGTSNDGFARTITITTAGDIQALIDFVELDTADGGFQYLFYIGNNSVLNRRIYGVNYQGSSGDGFIKTFDVDTSGNIVTITYIDSYEYDTADNLWYAPTLYVSGMYWLVVHVGTGNDGFSRTLQIYTNNPPTISGPSPEDGFIEVETTPQLSINVGDIGDIVNVTWTTNSTGVWGSMGTNNSVYTYGAISNSMTGCYYEFDAEEGYYADVIRLGESNYYAIVCTGDTGTEYDGFIRVIEAWNTNGTIRNSVIDSYEYDITDGIYPSIIHISGDIYAIAYCDATSTVYRVVTTEIDDADGDCTGAIIDTIDLSGTIASVLQRPLDFIQVSGHVYCVGFCDVDGDGWLNTIWINDTGTINDSRLDTEEFDIVDGSNPALCMIDSDTIAVLYAGYETDGYLLTHNITSAGLIADANSSWWEYEVTNGAMGDIIKIIGNVFLIAYEGSGNDGYVATVSISDIGTITKTLVDTYEQDKVDGGFQYLYQCSQNMFALTYQATGGDGFIKTFYVSDAGDICCFEYDELEYDTADSIYYAPFVSMGNDYYFIAWTGTSSDGFCGTFKLGNDTSETFHMTNSSMDTDGTTYWWNVTVSEWYGINTNTETFSFTTEEGEEPGATWQVVSSSVNGSIKNITLWKQTVPPCEVNGSIKNISAWRSFSTSINGSIKNITSWRAFSTSLNGSIKNVTIFRGVIPACEVNGSIKNISIGTWSTISTTINGSIKNLTLWHAFSSNINGSIKNLTIWRGIIPPCEVNGSIKNTTIWKSVNTSINGSIKNLTAAEYSTSIVLSGLTPVWNVTWYGTTPEGSATVTPVFCNATGYRNTTIHLDIAVNSTLLVDTISFWGIYMQDRINLTMVDVDNITVLVSIDNVTWGVLQDDQGSGMGRFPKGWGSLYWNWSTSPPMCQPYSYVPGVGYVLLNNVTLYARYMLNITDTASPGNYTNASGVEWQISILNESGGVGPGVIDTDTHRVKAIIEDIRYWQEIPPIGEYNGSIKNVSAWRTISSSVNGSIKNVSSWNIISLSINGSIKNLTIWRGIIPPCEVNGSIKNVSGWIIISSTINGSIKNVSSWSSFSTTINGSIKNITAWYTISSIINGSIKNTSHWIEIYFASPINGSIHNVTLSGSTAFNVNLRLCNPNPGNGTHGTNYIKRDSAGLTTSIDVFYQNFTTPPAMIPGSYSLVINGTPPSNVPTLWNSSAVYATVWGTHNGIITPGSLPYVGQLFGAGTYDIFRSYLMFNTSIIPDDAVIDSGYLSLIVWDDYSDTDFNVTIQVVKPNYFHEPLQIGDYWEFPYADDAGNLNTSGYTDEDYFNITLNATGLDTSNSINRTGMTKWGIRSAQDITASAPTGNEFIIFYGYGIPSTKYPKLIINFTVPSSNWQHIVNLTFYTNESGPWMPYNTTWVQSNGTATVPAVMFDAVARYWWNISYNSNHTNYGNTSYWWFETVMTGGGGGGGGGSQRTTTYFVLGACMGTLVGGLVLNIWRKKKKQTS